MGSFGQRRGGSRFHAKSHCEKAPGARVGRVGRQRAFLKGNLQGNPWKGGPYLKKAREA